MKNNYRAGFVGIIGFPNAGKSTLLNQLVEEKIAIVTSKPQTTRRRVQGVITTEEGQIIFVDSPGLTKPTSKLNEFLKAELEDVIKNSDVLVCVLSLDEKKEENIDAIIKITAEAKKPWVALINKIDIEKFQHRSNIIIQKLEKHGKKPYLLSAEKKNFPEQKEFIAELLKVLPESPGPLFEEDIITPHSYRDLVGEMVREKCFENLSQELPYQLAVLIRKYDETGPMIKIFADIVVERENHKAIVVGQKGSVIKKIGEQARKDIENLIGSKIYLDLTVVCKDQWSSKHSLMKELGYVVKSED